MKLNRDDRAMMAKRRWMLRTTGYFGGMPSDDEIRWELGERVINRGAWYTPMGFVLVYAAVIGWKWTARRFARLPGMTRLAPPLLRIGHSPVAEEDRLPPLR